MSWNISFDPLGFLGGLAGMFFQGRQQRSAQNFSAEMSDIARGWEGANRIYEAGFDYDPYGNKAFKGTGLQGITGADYRDMVRNQNRADYETMAAASRDHMASSIPISVDAARELGAVQNQLSFQRAQGMIPIEKKRLSTLYPGATTQELLGASGGGGGGGGPTATFGSGPPVAPAPPPNPMNNPSVISSAIAANASTRNAQIQAQTALVGKMFDRDIQLKGLEFEGRRTATAERAQRAQAWFQATQAKINERMAVLAERKGRREAEIHAEGMWKKEFVLFLKSMGMSVENILGSGLYAAGVAKGRDLLNPEHWRKYGEEMEVIADKIAAMSAKHHREVRGLLDLIGDGLGAAWKTSKDAGALMTDGVETALESITRGFGNIKEWHQQNRGYDAPRAGARG